VNRIVAVPDCWFGPGGLQVDFSGTESVAGFVNTAMDLGMKTKTINFLNTRLKIRF